MSGSDWSPVMGATTTRMMSIIENLEKSKIRLDDKLTDTEKELQERIESNVTLSRQQAELIITLIHQKEALERDVKQLRCQMKDVNEALFGTDEGKLGLVVEQRIMRRMITYGRIAATAAFGALVFAFQQGWIKGPA